MLIHPNPDKAMPIEQRVQGLICRQLMFRVDESQIFIPKEDFVDLLFLDIKALAKAEYDMETALEIAIIQQPHYSQMIEVKKVELQGALETHQVEIDAYIEYLECKKEELNDDEIYERILSVLGIDEDVFHNKMEEILFHYFHQRQSLDVDEETLQFLLLRLARGVKLIATTNSLEEALESVEYEDAQLQINRAFLEQLTSLTKEISAYKMAMSMYEQGSEIGLAIEAAKRTLGISD